MKQPDTSSGAGVMFSPGVRKRRELASVYTRPRCFLVQVGPSKVRAPALENKEQGDNSDSNKLNKLHIPTRYQHITPDIDMSPPIDGQTTVIMEYPPVEIDRTCRNM